MQDADLPDQPPLPGPRELRRSLVSSAARGFVARLGREIRAQVNFVVVDDVVPDANVYPDAPDPSTSGRQLEQLAFEIASTESLGHAGQKAAKLAGGGVRRVFAI